MGGVTAAATFVCPTELEVVRFIGALRLAEGVLLARKPIRRRASLTGAPRGASKHQQSRGADTEPERQIQTFRQHFVSNRSKSCSPDD